MLRRWTEILPLFMIKWLVRRDQPMYRHLITTMRYTDPDGWREYEFVEGDKKVDCYLVHNYCMLVYLHKSELEKKRDELKEKLDELEKEIGKCKGRMKNGANG